MIDDPLQVGNNVGRSSYHMGQIKKVFFAASNTFYYDIPGTISGLGSCKREEFRLLSKIFLSFKFTH